MCFTVNIIFDGGVIHVVIKIAFIHSWDKKCISFLTKIDIRSREQEVGTSFMIIHALRNVS